MGETDKKKGGAPRGNKNAAGNKGGAPVRYVKAMAMKAQKLCLLGATDKQIAEFFEVHPDTICEWRKKYIEFSEAFRRGKMVADSEVAASLYKRATGYKYKETTFERFGTREQLEEVSDRQITIDTFRKKIVIKELAPDVGAAIMWLKNRQKDIWRDKQEFGINFDSIPESQLDFIIHTITQRINS